MDDVNVYNRLKRSEALENLLIEKEIITKEDLDNRYKEVKKANAPK